MTEKEVFEGLTALALEDMQGVDPVDIEHMSFTVMMTATRADGSAVGGAFIVDPEIGDMSSEELVKTGSVPSLTSYIIMRQATPVVNRCITAAVTLKNLDKEKSPVPAKNGADVEGSKH